MRTLSLFAIVVLMSTLLTTSQTLPTPQAITDPKQVASKPNAEAEKKSNRSMVAYLVGIPSLVVLLAVLGMLIPLLILIVAKSGKFNEDMRKLLYFTSVILIQLGIFSTRWNVVIGGQLFSKSFLGYTTYKMAFATREGLLPAVGLLILPLVILWGLLALLPPWRKETA